jgi:hypothetical protein
MPQMDHKAVLIRRKALHPRRRLLRQVVVEESLENYLPTYWVSSLGTSSSSVKCGFNCWNILPG